VVSGFQNFALPLLQPSACELGLQLLALYALSLFISIPWTSWTKYREEAVVAYFKLLIRYLPGGSEGDHRKPYWG